jgi:D-beta-D-heptose 7-phosphate kinase/D-beta-D-heptose 1-phosphate adenosyltransferase
VVDYIIIFEEDTPLQLIKALEPDLLIKGGDYLEEDIVGYKEVIGSGGKVITIPLLEGYSTSSIIGGSPEED